MTTCQTESYISLTPTLNLNHEKNEYSYSQIDYTNTGYRNLNIHLT